MTRPVYLVVLRWCAVVLSLLVANLAAFAQTFSDSGFTAETAAQVTRFNTVGFTFAPDGRIFTWEKPGVVRIVKNGTMLSTPFIDLRSRVNQAGDRGLLGLALDPNFTTNGFVYLLYVHETTGNSSDLGPKAARLTRVKADAANPDIAQASSEVVLLGKIGTAPCSSSPVGADCMASDSTAHTIGTVRFGSDGKIYVGMGDGASFSTATEQSFRTQDLNYYNGKILRINPDGTAPSDNPFYDGNPNSVRSKVYAYGLRNPFRFTNKPGSSEVYIGDVGAAKFEEINRGRGANFGWPCYEGPDPQFTFTNAFPQRCAAIPASAVTKPLYSYDWNGGASIVMGPFYTGTQYPTQFRNNLFFADFVQGFIRRAVFDANNNLTGVQSFATGVETPVHLEQGPDGFLYYMNVTTGELRRIRFSGTAPIAVATATRPSAAQPYTIAFSSAGSTGGTLTYAWEFGDGTTSTAANPTHTYVATGVRTFTAKLTITNAQGLTDSDSIDVVVGGRLPVATITAPANNLRIKAGTRVTFTGTASDPDETLPASAMKWNVLLHHNEHIHPGVTATGASGSFVVEDHGNTGETYFYEIVLTVTDSAGLTDTKRVNVIPESTTPPPTTLPTPWLAQSVGTVGVAGSASHANGTFTLKGSGADIDGTSDGFFYIYQKLLGDGEIKARVASVQNTAPGAKAGVMMRSALTGNAAHTLLSISPVEGVAFERRDEPGFGTALVSGGEFVPPRWVRLVRSGNTITSFHSADGTTWTQVSSATIPFPAEVFVGLAVTSNNNAVLSTSVFDNVSVIKTTTNTPPVVTLTAPLTGATFTAPASIRLIAEATDSDGISKVEFFHGSTLLNTQTLAPYDPLWSNVQPGTYSVTARATDKRGAVTTSSPITVTVNSGGSTGVTGTGTGLRGNYYDHPDLTNFKLSRVDPQVNFNWGDGKPTSSLNNDEVSVRWTGQVQPRFSGAYTFHTQANDGVRLWVNGQLIINDWNTRSSAAERSGTITFVAGQKYTIKLEYFDFKGPASVVLLWSSSSQVKQVIPKSQLYPAAAGGDDD